ncbi:MAG TPA: DUF2520 domain-containing protein [Syntrophomonadaceae bacterium]|nr:DUF2520 domain-containing protein [Syntrophomonadaceae bacterium]
MRIGFVGAGKVGSAVALLLQRAGYEVAGIASRSRASAEKLASRLGCPVLPAAEVSRRADGLFITTSDDAIAGVAAEIAEEGAFHTGQFVLHMSGALTSRALEPAAAQGAITLSIHPIQSFATVEKAVALLPGSYFSIEGDERGYGFAGKVVEDLGGHSFILDSGAKVLYHAAAVTACNYLVGLLACSMRMLEAAGVPEEVGMPAFLPLVTGTFENIRSLGIPGALTGPIARGDTGTLEKHLEALEDLPVEKAVYTALGLVTVDVAFAKGAISREQAAKLRSLLESYPARNAATLTETSAK